MAQLTNKISNLFQLWRRFFISEDAVLGPAAFGGRALAGLAGLLGPSALRALVWPSATLSGP